MDVLIEKYAMQCTSWPYWRDMPSSRETPADFITEWPSHVTEEQKAFWRLFIKNLLDDLRNEVSFVNTNKLDEILNKLNK